MVVMIRFLMSISFVKIMSLKDEKLMEGIFQHG
jgi:hypothetical protein